MEMQMNLINQPVEILVDILKRVPAESVCRIRCVCKMLLSTPPLLLSCTCIIYLILVLMYRLLLLTSSCFNSIHLLTTTGRPCGHFITITPHSQDQGAQLNVRDFLHSLKPSFYTVPFAFCNLFCMKHVKHTLSFLINPFRGEVLRLPRSDSYVQQVYGPSSVVQFVWTGMGFDSTTNTFKILRVTEIVARNPPSKGTLFVSQVLELGKSVWREIDLDLDLIPSFKCVRVFKSLFVYGDMHWLCYTTRDGISGHHILSFDFKKEKFFWTPTPYTLSVWMWQLHMITLRGYMAIVDTTSGVNIEIWVMKDYNRKQWVLDCSVNIQMLELDPEFEFLRAVCSEWEHGIMFINEPGTITVFLDLRGPVVANNFKCPTVGRNQWKRIMNLNGSLISLKSFANLVEGEEPTTYSNWTEGETSGKKFLLSEDPLASDIYCNDLFLFVVFNFLL